MRDAPNYKLRRIARCASTGAVGAAVLAAGSSATLAPNGFTPNALVRQIVEVGGTIWGAESANEKLIAFDPTAYAVVVKGDRE